MQFNQTTTRGYADRFIRPIVYAHLASGVMLWPIGRYPWPSAIQDIQPAYTSLATLFALLTFIACPLLAVGLSMTTRLTSSGAARLLTATALNEALQIVAIFPAFQ